MINKEKIEDILNVLMSAGIVNVILYFFKGSGFENLLIMAPFIVILYKYGLKEYIATIILSMIPAYFILGLNNLIFQFAMILAISSVIVYAMKKRMTIGKIVGYSSIVGFLVIVLALLASYLMTDENPFLIIQNQFMEAVDNFETILLEDINFTEKMVSEYIVYIKQVLNNTLRIIPAIFLIYAMIISFVNFVLSVFIMRKTGVKVLYNTKLNRLRLDRNFRYVFMFIALSMIFKYIFGEEIGIIAENLWTVGMALLFFNGLSYFDYYMEMRIGKFARIMMWIIILFIFRFYTFIMVLGFLDLFTFARYRISRER